MTEQIADSCVFDGRRWEIESEWNEGLKDIVPTSEMLGFKTDMNTTANWSGRIDHFLVYNDSLYLYKIEVDLDKNSHDFIPKRAGKEIITRYEPVTIVGNTTGRIYNVGNQSYRKHEFVYFVFGGGDFRLPYTGGLILLYPYIDLWEIPATEDDPDFKKHATLTFEDGMLVDQNVKDIN